MKLLLLLCALVGAAAVSDEVKLAYFQDFKQTFNRQYVTEAEEAVRFQCFGNNLDIIEVANQDPTDTATYHINAFADLCHEEFKQRYNGYRPRNTTNQANTVVSFPVEEAEQAAADSVDWRKKGAVSHVKNQGSCGSCWSFSATGNMEGQNAIKTGKMVTLSEEELVQCDKVDAGCNGGLMDNAFEWVKKNGGITSESAYPYTSGGGKTGTCASSKTKNPVVKVSGHIDVAHDEKQMAAWVLKNGPLSIAVDAGILWQMYGGGIKKSCKAGQVDHGVLIVGYGTSSGTDYWIIKNSWAASWGESGYIRLERGVNCNSVRDDPCSATL